ncbi:hypothetical protein T12_10946, partial [Trichinella patagoniensis]
LQTVSERSHTFPSHQGSLLKFIKSGDLGCLRIKFRLQSTNQQFVVTLHRGGAIKENNKSITFQEGWQLLRFYSI